VPISWAGTAGAWATARGSSVLHGAYGTTADGSALLLTYLDPATGNTVNVQYSRWPQIPAGGTALPRSREPGMSCKRR